MGRTGGRRRRSDGEGKRAAAYMRVSTGVQAEEGESLPAQQARLHAWARENGYVIVREYVDAGESARTADRPQFVRMLQDAKTQPRPFDTILVWKWDRFARNMEDASMYKALFRRRLGIEIISITQPAPDGAVGQLLERMLDIIAEFQSALTAENVYSTMSFLAEQGRWLGKRPFGYDLVNGRLVVNPAEAEAVRWAFRQVAERKTSIYAIVEAFATGARFPCTLARGYKWSPTAVRKMLQNEVYTGTLIWNRRYSEIGTVDGISRKMWGIRDPDEWIRVPDAHAAIVDRETFDAVQRVLREYTSRRPQSRQGEYLFRGMVRCARCGGSFSFCAPSGGLTPRLACSRYFRPPSQACRPMNYIKLSELEEIVLTTVAAILGGQQPAPLRFDVLRRVRQPSPEALLAANAQKVARLLEAYEAGAISLDDLRTRRALLAQEAQRLRQAVARGEDRLDYERQVASLRERLSDVVAILRSEETPVEQKNQALSLVIERIVVDREARQVEIFWHLVQEA